MHEPLSTVPPADAHAGCTCADADGADPVLDVRTIPPAIRHPAIFGALDALAGGSALVLVAPHDPLPLLAHARDRYGESVTVEYLQRGPDAWRLRLQRA